MKIEDQGLITLDASNVPLATLLQALSKKVPLEIRGGVAPDERVSVQFARLSLKDALAKMIRNYNYVLVMPEGKEKPVLTIVNAITRAPMRDEPQSVPTARGSPSPGAPQGAPPAPGRLPGTHVALPTEDPGRQVTERRPGPDTPLPGMPPAVAPGLVLFPQPRPQGSPDTPSKKETQASPQGSAAASAPEQVMTPFGFRSVTPPETDTPSTTRPIQMPTGIPGVPPTRTAPAPLTRPQDRPVP